MKIRYFLGANSAHGFVSRYDTLLERRNQNMTRIIKGGPGCGKSTLMKKAASCAAALGLEVENIICSSDIDSLDGIVIPSIGYAITDGTAPHVSEPPLCGCGACYLDLGSAYDTEGLNALSPVLGEIRHEGKVCYEAAVKALSAAAAATYFDASEQQAESYASTAKSIAEKLFSKRTDVPESRICFFSGYTPSGFIRYDQTILEICSSVYLIQGSADSADAFLRTMHRLVRSLGWNTMLGDSPLLPGKYYEQLLVPQAGIAFVYDNPNLPWSHGSDACIGVPLSSESALALKYWTDKAITKLSRVKEYHALLEKICAPYVDFSVADRMTGLCCKEIQKFAENC